jgi:hypothetical protein
MEAVVKRRLSNVAGFLANPDGGKDLYFCVDGCRNLLPGQVPILPRCGERVIVLKEEKTPKGPRAVEWMLP